MKVSVIIPCYNCEAYILKCLSSLETQTIRSINVFLVNDCSTDGTEDVILSYIKESSLDIHYITNDTNLGPSKSREKAIKLSDADFICFCDSDDWYESNFIEEMLRKQSENNADIVFCAYKLVFSSGECSNRDLMLTKEDLGNRSSIIVKSPDSLCMMMTRRKLFSDIVMPDLRNGEDMAIVPILIANAATINITDKHLYNYYCRSGSASQSANMNQITSLIKSFQYINEHLPDNFIIEREFIGIRNLIYAALINLFKFSNDYKLAGQILNSFEQSYPEWYKNKYIPLLSAPKRVFINLVNKRYFKIASILSYAHRLLIS